ncbi:S8 family peptidase [Propioniciclava soli]|uniref:S8 family peptidase n=1 Tax=Propioniciclava soli TaxID=2775081 RepID=UPI001E42A199
MIAGVAALAIAATPMVAYAAPATATGADRFEKTQAGLVDTAIMPTSLTDTEPVDVIVEMASDPVAVVQAKQGSLSERQKENVRSKLRGEQAAVADAAEAEGGEVLAQMQDAYNGVKVRVSKQELTSLAEKPGVKAIHAVEIHERTNHISVPYLGVPEVWESTGYTGAGIKVAIIDTGIDYTHADFGGPGTVEAFEAAEATSTEPADPALFGPNAPRIKGGIDLVGNDYDAGEADSVPQPDPNPLDCNGHGTHVAGSTGGGGVTADGQAYSGPYNAATADQDWLIGPGVAPEVDLYAVRVFGCSGSTDVTVEAIDWSVANGMDVINMSLGSSYGTADDPSAVAAANAVGAGVVVVASAGNSGPNPYLTGSPGTGRGVISVAANDATESFPAARITLPDGSSIDAINANGAALPSGPARVVVLKDNPATGENEALGCSVNAYTSNGITPGYNQVAVSQRGTCARVARAIYAQQAGAVAAVMVNNTAAFPPYEGPIVENPDDGTPYTVTIPFLGVRGVLGTAPTDDGDRLVAAAGGSVTMTASTLANPTFSEYGSFTSGGPRTGDSGAKPNVTAPGVSIRSAQVGAGNGFSYKSGTSMAAPHVAGVAALAVEAHPTWNARALSDALVNTADADAIANYRLTLGGAGLVDPAGVVAARVTASGDQFTTTSGVYREPSLSFGFAESTKRDITGVKRVVLTNHTNAPVTYTVSTEASPQSKPATVSVNRQRVTVPANRTATVQVTLRVPVETIGGALEGGFAMHEVSGSVVFTGPDTIKVPYLLVPRADSDLTAAYRGRADRNNLSINLRNRGAVEGVADIYQAGLEDAEGDATLADHPGTDVRAAGVQSFETDGNDQLLVFAINSWDRYSNAARNNTQVIIDTNGDDEADYVVYATDSGLVRTGNVDGSNEVFIRDVANARTLAAGYLAQSPTDNSTVLIPVRASSLGLSAEDGDFTYTAYVSSITDSGANDSFDGSARYNPWAPALETGQYEPVAAGSNSSLPITIDADALADQQPLGSMVVVVDNAAGAAEAQVLQLQG